MKKFFLVPLFIQTALLSAQDISTHIPQRSTYIVTINPSTHVGNGDLKQLNDLEMFSRNGESGTGYLYGASSLDEDRRIALGKLFSDVFSNPASTGIDTARKIFIFNDTPDSIHYWSYLLPLNNSSAFSDYITANLFSKKPEINKGSGFSEVNAEKISIGWTNSYAIILLADYDYSYTTENYFEQLTHSQMITDSITAAENYQSEMQVQVDTAITDSLRTARTNQLMQEEKDMEEKLAKDTTPEEDVVVDTYDYGSSEYDANSDLEQQRKDSLVMRLAILQLNEVMNLSYEESIQSVANFRTVNAEKADGVYWYNYGEMMQQYYEQNMSYRSYYQYSMMEPDTANIQNMWKGSYVVSLVHFEGNVAKMEQRSYFSPQLLAHTKGLYAGRVDKKMFRYVKGDNLLGFVAMSVNMEKFMKFYGTVYRESLSNSVAGVYETYYLMMWDMLRIFLDEKTMYNLFDGQFVFAVTDLKPYTASYVTYDYDENFNATEVKKERTEIRPEFIMVAGIGKKKKAQDILDILERANAIKKQNSLYYLINTPGEYDVKMFLAIQDGMLIITNNEELMLTKLKHGYRNSSAMKHSLKHLGRESALVGWWDGNKSFDLIRKNQVDSLSQQDKAALDALEQNVSSGEVIGRRMKKGVQRIDVMIELNSTQGETKQTDFVRFFNLLNSLFLIRNYND